MDNAQIVYTNDFSYLLSLEKMNNVLIKKDFFFKKYQTEIRVGDKITRLGNKKGGTYLIAGWMEYLGVYTETDDSEWLIFEQSGQDGLFDATLHTDKFFAYYAYLFIDDDANPLHYFTTNNGCQLLKPNVIEKVP